MSNANLERPFSPEERNAAIRRTVIGRLDMTMEFAEEMMRTESSTHGSYQFMTREPQFGVPCDVSEFTVDQDATTNSDPDYVRIYRPVIDPMYLEHPRSVSYWVEVGRHNPDELEDELEMRGLFYEVSPLGERFVSRTGAGAGEVLDFPVPIDISTGNFPVKLQGLIEDHGQNIVERFGLAPHIEPRFDPVN